MAIIEVPYKELESITLRKLVEEFIMREGTDYGAVEMDLDQKIGMVINQLKEGDAALMWDTNLQSSNIVLKKGFNGREAKLEL
jgi:uncharacterized protein